MNAGTTQYMQSVTQSTLMQKNRILFYWSFYCFLYFFYLTCFILYLNSEYLSDVVQGEYVKIVYIHVPCAWWCTFFYISATLIGIFYYLYKNPLFLIICDCLIINGLILTFLTLITGSLWGFPTWGTYWVWDARLTSVFLLFLFYLTYILIKFFSYKIKMLNDVASFILLLGLVLIPIIKYSVTWWSTLHQPSTISLSSNISDSSIHIFMGMPLLLSSIALFFLIVFFICAQMRYYILEIKLYSFYKTKVLNS